MERIEEGAIMKSDQGAIAREGGAMMRPRKKRIDPKVVISVDVYEDQEAMESHLDLYRTLKWPGHRKHTVLVIEDIGGDEHGRD